MWAAFCRSIITSRNSGSTCNDISRLPAAFVSRFQRPTLKEYTKEQFIEVAVGLAKQYLLMKDTDRREQVAEEIATKLYDDKNVKDVRQLIDVTKLYSIQKTKKVDEIFSFREAY